MARPFWPTAHIQLLIVVCNFVFLNGSVVAQTEEGGEKSVEVIADEFLANISSMREARQTVLDNVTELGESANIGTLSSSRLTEMYQRLGRLYLDLAGYIEKGDFGMARARVENLKELFETNRTLVKSGTEVERNLFGAVESTLNYVDEVLDNWIFDWNEAGVCYRTHEQRAMNQILIGEELKKRKTDVGSPSSTDYAELAADLVTRGVAIPIGDRFRDELVVAIGSKNGMWSDTAAVAKKRSRPFVMVTKKPTTPAPPLQTRPSKRARTARSARPTLNDFLQTINQEAVKECVVQQGLLGRIAPIWLERCGDFDIYADYLGTSQSSAKAKFVRAITKATSPASLIAYLSR